MKTETHFHLKDCNINERDGTKYDITNKCIDDK